MISFKYLVDYLFFTFKLFAKYKIIAYFKSRRDNFADRVQICLRDEINEVYIINNNNFETILKY